MRFPTPLVRRALAPAVFAILAAPALSAPTYTLTDIAPLSGYVSCEASAINASGQVAGTATDAGGNTRAFRFQNGTSTALNTLGGAKSYGQCIDDTGTVAGGATPADSQDTYACTWSNPAPTELLSFASTVYGTNNSQWTVGEAGGRAFLCNSGGAYDLGKLSGYDFAEAFDVNNNGIIVGDSSQYFGLQHAFAFDANGMHDLGALDGNQSQAFAINDKNQIVGLSSNGAFNIHAFLWDAGTMTDIGTLGGYISAARGINNLGQVVGDADTSGGARHAFLYQSGTMVDLNTLIPANSGFVLEYAYGINDAGQVVGSGTIGGQTHGFLLTPIVQAPPAANALGFAGGLSAAPDKTLDAVPDGASAGAVDICDAVRLARKSAGLDK